MPDPHASPADLIRAVTLGVGRLVTGGMNEPQQAALLDELAGYYAEYTDVRHPFAPLGDTPLRTRQELRNHFADAVIQSRSAGEIEFAPSDMTVHQTADPEVVIVEFSYRGSASGQRFELPCIYVVRARGGEIIESRDYGHHVESTRVFGGLGNLAAALANRATRA
ncbi:nuclear transport factor 2 family protein [Nocardia sp. CA-084685]|uniref:nuclear transport factor 2 family protein n=1 Tax=Nocardia sp. CA-084685 TaxID=3239970 RepID=UPI003D95E3A1